MMKTTILITKDTPLEEIIALGEEEINSLILSLENTDRWTDMHRNAMMKLMAARFSIWHNNK